MLVKNQAVQEVQNILIVDKRHSNECRIIKSELESRIRLNLCDHSTFTLKSPLIPKVLFLNMVAKFFTNHYSVSQFTIQVYIKRQKKCFRLSKNNEDLKPVRLGISKRPLTCFFCLFCFFCNLSPKLRCEGFELLIQCLMFKGQSKSAVSVILSPSPALTGSTFPKTM